MRLTLEIAIALATLTTAAQADKLITTQTCRATCATIGGFYTDFGDYTVDVRDGCHPTDVPGMVEFCVDWARGRAHFRFSHQDFKRCLIKGETYWEECNVSYCGYAEWREAPCTWRQISGDAVQGTPITSKLRESVASVRGTPADGEE